MSNPNSPLYWYDDWDDDDDDWDGYHDYDGSYRHEYDGGYGYEQDDCVLPSEYVDDNDTEIDWQGVTNGPL